MRISLEELKKNPEKIKKFNRVLIYSGEHQAYWREYSRGYTLYPSQAGVYEAEEAFDNVRHCDENKMIYLEHYNIKPDNKGKLISIASGLLTPSLSDNIEDYPKSVPKWLIRNIETHNNKLRLIAIQITDIAKYS